MRYLILLRGTPGSGKSHFLQESGLLPYSLSKDNLRILLESPFLDYEGHKRISQDNNKEIIELLLNILERKMQRGDFIVIDATHSQDNEINIYKNLVDTYRYKVFCLDFSEVTLSECLQNNKQRPEFKHVPDEAIKSIYKKIKQQILPNWLEVIRPQEFGQFFGSLQQDFEKYRKIHHIGDLQGCFAPLKKYFDETGGIKEDELYIFLGDYCDRGKENHLVMEYVLGLKEKPNIIFLEGNHEAHLWRWANNYEIFSRDFIPGTKSQLEAAKISKTQVKDFSHKLQEVVLYNYYGKTVLVTHGGLPSLPQDLHLIQSRQLIRGVGGYHDVSKINQNFLENTDKNTYQIHGHRNLENLPTQINPRTFVLEGKVEFGGHLRIVTVDQKNGFQVVEVEN
jgi:predicted kinase